jgi:hypothetical protein
MARMQKNLVEPKTKGYRGEAPLAFVVSMNLQRRQLNESQRAMVVAKIATFPSAPRSPRGLSK